MIQSVSTFRVQQAKGLRQGASPLLLPDSRPGARQIDTHTSSYSQMMGGALPSDHVLRHSEFLYPLDSETERLYIDLLSGLQSR